MARLYSAVQTAEHKKTECTVLFSLVGIIYAEGWTHVETDSGNVHHICSINFARIKKMLDKGITFLYNLKGTFLSDNFDIEGTMAFP